MKPKHYLLLFVIALAFILVEAALLQVPGYMDAEYYYAGGSQLAAGKGFNEPFLWNFLDDPAGIPHPAFTYWMPLTSLLSGFGMFLFGRINFFNGRIFFFLIAASIPPLAAYFSWQLSHRVLNAWLAAGLAVFSGFYAIYMGITDTFALYMLLGSLFLILALHPGPSSAVKLLGLGLIVGLMHLARADGILWLGCGFILVMIETGQNNLSRSQKLKFAGRYLGILFLGYLLVMAPWFVRNISLYGALFSPASGKVLWLTDYNQMFAFPASQLTLRNWLNSGLESVLNDRLVALGLNLQTTLAVQADIFLLPLMLVGFWRQRKTKLVQLGLAMWGLTFVVMTAVFPLAGARGGFFHSGAAFQPLLWAVAVDGYNGLIELGVRKRNWKFERASKGFGLILVFLSAMVTLALFIPKVSSDETKPSPWSKSSSTYQAVDQYLVESGASGDQIVLVNNSPGYFTATGRSAIVIPDGDVNTMMAVARKYGASYLVLEQNTVDGLRGLFQNPQSLAGLEFLRTIDQVHIFRILMP